MVMLLWKCHQCSAALWPWGKDNVHIPCVCMKRCVYVHVCVYVHLSTKDEKSWKFVQQFQCSYIQHKLRGYIILHVLDWRAAHSSKVQVGFKLHLNNLYCCSIPIWLVINKGSYYKLTLFFSFLLLWNISAICTFHDILYPTLLHPLTLLLPLCCQTKYIYGTCAGKTVSRRRPTNFIFKMPAINLSNGLNWIGVTHRAIRHGLSLRGLWAYLSRPKTSAGRRNQMNMLEKYAENKNVCAYLYALRSICASIN